MAEEAAGAATATATETLEQLQARHRKEAKDLQGRITSKKKNATKKTRKFVNDECAELERALKERHEEEVRALLGEEPPAQEEEEEEDQAAGEEVNGELAAGLKSVQIKEPAQRQQQQAQQNGGDQQQAGGQGGKKRNRQKDRLARRAAEAEAAAIAAESEAANMTDYRSIERSSMLKQFETHGLEEKEIAPDGHCLFSAVADQLAVYGVNLDVPIPGYAGDKGTEGGAGYRKVRQVAAGYMTSHADDYAPFLEEPLESYVAKIRDTAEWGGQLELSALANAYGVEIKVVQTDGRTEVIRPNGVPEGKEDLKTVWLAYYKHGFGLGEHYNSLRKKGGEGK
ncbi:hypothetical protein V8F20_007488 [Naviculisporaceae sp. PSN 640]